MAFRVAALNLPGLIDASAALAASRAGELGVLDLEYARDQWVALQAVKKLADAAKSDFGIKLNGDRPSLIAKLMSELPDHLKTVVLTSTDPQILGPLVTGLHEKNVAVLLEVNCLEQAQTGQAIGVDAVIARGHEAGGRVSDETTFVLVQRFLGELRLPVWAQGGIGLHTAAACAAAGTAGVILDSQLALTRESPLSDAVRARIASMDGSETLCLGAAIGETYRVYFRPGSTAVEELRRIETRLMGDERSQSDVLADWRQALAERIGWDSPDQNVLFLGQDAAFAESLAKNFATVGGALRAMREAIEAHCQAASSLQPLNAGAPLARAQGTRYPILQGPMTRVSDVPEFAARVAEGGALPFLALALMRGPEVKTLLTKTQQRLGAQPWGVGILGFVPPELRQEQLDAIQDYRPPFALIAGGRPDQARALEQQGISTYLHVPSPGLLKMFLQQGARRFVFEGRECGGHVGPRTSFVLWNQMIDVLLEALTAEPSPQNYHIVFAGGIHDSLSAAMVASMAAPLAEQGARIGVLLGTAYLFTEEAVTAGAILKRFQEQAVRCERTVLLESGPGHSTRCIDTPFAETFRQEKRQLSAAGRSAEEMRLALEELNLGRLRIAAKGITRDPNFGQEPEAPKFLSLHEEEQVAQGMYMIGQVATMRNQTCTIEALHRDVAVEGSNRVQALTGQRWQIKSIERLESPSDIAIVGMACLLPKAEDLQAYWGNILNKVDAITEIPKDRWNWELYFDPDPKAPDKIYSKWGGFIDDIPFDPMQYGMPPASLRSIEPAQLLTLEVVRAALNDAGYLDRPFPRERTSVILGSGGGAADLGLGYGSRAFLPNLELLPEFRGRSPELLDRLNGMLPEWTEDSFAGILTNVSAGRVANRFDLGGTNYTVDAACASSLAAVSLAVKELEGHTSDMVIVGGVDTMQNPFIYLCFSKTKALSPRGRCRTFDEGADGIVISEGLAVMVLKRLADAERDGDRIYALIKGIGSSSDGKDKGLTAPRPEGQARALRRAYAKANFSPATVGLIEAHGTGTVAGDRAEVRALTDVFAEAQAQPQHCAIGSVKSMIGHTKCTAGAAGLIKTALALYHKVLPPTLGVEKPNPSVDFSRTPFFVNAELRPWLDSVDGHPRRAGVSAFGFGGTNFHVAMEEYTGDIMSSRPVTYQLWPSELFLWQGDSRQALLEASELCDKALDRNAQPRLHDLAYTVWKLGEEKFSGQDSTPLRLAVIATSLDDLKQKLTWARQALANPETVRISDPRGIYFSEQPLVQAGAQTAKLAFLFSGQGSQYPNMLRDLAIQFPEVRRLFELGDQVLAGQLAKPLSAYIFPPSSFSPEESRAQQQALTQTNVAQPALGVADLAMFRILQALDLQPDFAAGHSYGEYVALAAAGVLSEEALIALSEARGRFIVEAAGDEPGIMAAIEAERDVVSRGIEGIEGVNLANSNAPKQTVISGSREAVEKAVQHLSAQGLVARVIPVACAFHSPIVAPAQERLAKFLSTADLAEPQITVFSNTTAAPYPVEPAAIASRLVEHLVRPVEFMREIEAMYAAGARIFVEVGPRGILTSLVDQILGDRPRLAVASDQSGRSGLAQLLHLLGHLAAQGVAVKLDRLYQGRPAQRLDLKAVEGGAEQKRFAPTVWLVNGGRARPWQETKDQVAIVAEKVVPTMPSPTDKGNGLRMPLPTAAASPRTSSAPARTGNGKLPTTPLLDEVSNAPLVASAIQSSAHTIPSDDRIPAAMVQFQQLMARFLDVQKSVMLSYLGSVSDGATLDRLPSAALLQSSASIVEPSKNLHHTAPASVFADAENRLAACGDSAAPISEPVLPTASTPTLPVKELTVETPARLDAGQITSRLLAIVSERTGYPSEMLDLNLDLEADLGIDSIKRVEILGNFQQSVVEAGPGRSDGMMEKLAGAKTLRGIIERIVEQLSLDPQPDQSEITLIHRRPDKRFAKSADTSAPSDSAQGAEQIGSRLLAIVSERTGYPPEMLDLDLDLEADLGIDSIKRVEILGNFQQSVAVAGPEQGDGLMEKLSGVKTLRGIIERIVEQLSLNLQPDRSAAAPVEARPDERSTEATARAARSESGQDIDALSKIKRFTLTPVEVPLPRTIRTSAKGRVILLTEDELGVARALAAELHAEGQTTAIVRFGKGARAVDQGVYEADLSSPHEVARLVDVVHQMQGSLGGIVHLLPLCTGVKLAEMEVGGWRKRLRLETKSLFYLAKTVSEDLKQAAQAGGACLIAATGMGGSFLSTRPSDVKDLFAGQGGVVGLIKTLARELPEVLVKAVDLNCAEPAPALASHLLVECAAGDDQVEVGYDGHRRLVLELRPTPLDLEGPSGLDLDPSSVFLITGGARGITSRVARQLAERYQPTLLLAGRSPLPDEESTETAALTSPKELKAVLMEQLRSQGQSVTPVRVESAYARLIAQREVRSNIDALQRLGAKVHYYPVDVRDGEAFGNLIDQIYDSFGRLDGVVHGAGVIEDKLIQDKTPESFDRVFDTKADSAFVLSQKLRPEKLKFLVFFASVAGRFGNRGQGDYAAANEVLNKLAAQLDTEWPGRVVSINWGPWDADGMVSPEVRKQFAERGVELIPPSVGLLRFAEELHYGRKGESEVVIGGFGRRPPAHQSIDRPIASQQSLPLIRRAQISRSNGSIQIDRRLEPAYDRYLQDHCLDGRPVFPLAIATELMAEVAAFGWSDLQVAQVRDLFVLQGIVLRDEAKTVRVVGKCQEPVADGPLSIAVEIVGIEHPQRMHYRAVVDLVQRLPDPPPFEPLLPTNGPTLSIDLSEIYRQWLFHGPLFQGIHRIDHIATDGIVAALASSSPTGWILDASEEPWLIDPLMLDSGLQLLILWSREHWDMTTLPSRFQTYRRFATPPTKHLHCEVRIKPNTGGQTIHADIVFVNADGQVISILEDIEGSCTRTLNRLVGRDPVALSKE
jgi:acyl transferase domain-containing protein/NAD(P)H-dependent flavin oxidoreductase YrpB (nitropropane dioxygenase family)/NAD(P)-dependent dehydrogenase (short-subunit alcohol dehydrogenase family)/acyl carrier protein